MHLPKRRGNNMETMTKRDNRSSQIKKILKKAYPTAFFSVRIDKYSMGESINIKTDLFKESAFKQESYALECKLNREGLAGDDFAKWQDIKKTNEYNRNLEKELHSLVMNFQHVDYDKYSGEILSGGNTYLFIQSARNY